MGGDVNPIEWVVPPLAIAHYSTKAAVKGSKQIAGEIADPPKPQQTLGTPITAPVLPIPEADDLSRQRAIRARQGLGESTRASDQLTGSLG